MITMTTNQDTKKCRDALNLFIESVIKPDHVLRQCAHEQGCFKELMEIRESVLEHLRELKP